ncbi:cytochrome P450 [Streptomyces sp. NBC_00144]|uniref:hypothetical protein n=1 Tax=Streptomyces sp. NBC_00144 TaxID=2975665 RepID=UPI0032517413
MEAGRLRASSPAVIDTVLVLLDERRRDPGDDLLTTLATARDEPPQRMNSSTVLS